MSSNVQKETIAAKRPKISKRYQSNQVQPIHKIITNKTVLSRYLIHTCFITVDLVQVLMILGIL